MFENKNMSISDFFNKELINNNFSLNWVYIYNSEIKVISFYSSIKVCNIFCTRLPFTANNVNIFKKI